MAVVAGADTHRAAASVSERVPEPTREAAAQADAGGPIVIVANSASGSARAYEALREANKVLFAALRPVTPLLAAFGGDVPELAERAARMAADQHGVVVAAGGDGTVAAVATALLALADERGQPPPPLGVLPLGTFNYFARAHDLPADPAEAARVWLGGATRDVQTGVVNGHAFLVHAALGLYARMLEDRETFKRLYGRRRIVAAWAGLTTLLRRHAALELLTQIEGEQRTIAATTLFVGNNRLQLEQLGLPQAAAVEHGELAMLWLRPTTPWQRLLIALRGAAGDIAGAKAVDAGSFRRMTVQPRRRRAQRPIKVALDGEISRLVPPLHFEVAHWPLALLVPEPAAPAEADRPGDPGE